MYCCNCGEVEAKLVYGDTVYPHRKDLYEKPFWKCPICGEVVGCHPNTTTPLGCIPNYEIKNARRHIHNLMDPLWKEGKISRKVLYNTLSRELGYKYHTANIRDIEEARRIYKILLKIKEGL
jgi:hypothetical protein